MDIVLDYIESLAFWRAHRIASKPTRMSKNPILRDVYAGLGDPSARVHVVPTPARTVPIISFDACKRIPTQAIRDFILGKFEPFILSDSYKNYAEKTLPFTISAMNWRNRYRTSAATPHAATGLCAIRAALAQSLSHAQKPLQAPQIPHAPQAIRIAPDLENTQSFRFLVSRQQRGLSTRNKSFRFVSPSVPSGSFFKLVVSQAEALRFGLPPALSLHILSPEMIFALAARDIKRICGDGTIARALFAHNMLLLAQELCGNYGYDPLTATAVTYGLDPLTSVEKIRRALERYKYMHARKATLSVLKYCQGGLASPFEGLVAGALMLPSRLGGICFPKLDVNKTRVLRRTKTLTPEHQTITPDLSSRALKLVIECNGREFHNNEDAFREDQRRIRDYASKLERHIALCINDVKNPLLLTRALLQIVAACRDKLGRARTYRLRKRINDVSHQVYRHIMIALHLA